MKKIKFKGGISDIYIMVSFLYEEARNKTQQGLVILSWELSSLQLISWMLTEKLWGYTAAHNILLSNMMTLKSGWEGHKHQRYANTTDQTTSDYLRFNNNWNFYFSHWDTILHTSQPTCPSEMASLFFCCNRAIHRSPLLIVIHPSISFRILPLKGS